jgi:hypothetical protein
MASSYNNRRTNGDTLEIFTINPNGPRGDVVYITPVPNSDHSGINYLLQYRRTVVDEMPQYTTELYTVGYGSSIGSGVWFKGCTLTGLADEISARALSYISEWQIELHDEWLATIR